MTKKTVNTAKKGSSTTGWKGMLAGFILYFVWFLLSNTIRFLSGPWQSAGLYAVFFILILVWAIAAKNNPVFLSFTAITLILKCVDQALTWADAAGTFFFLVTAALCLYKIPFIRSAFTKKRNRLKQEKQISGGRPGIILLNLIIILMMLIGVRESDIMVSKFYFNPWPIYPDYVYPPDVERINFSSLDGTSLNGWFIPGKSPDAKKRPVIFYLHGNSGNMAAQYGQFQFLSEWGYDVFTFDYRGFGLSGGKVSRQGLWLDTKAAFRKMTELHPGRRYGVMGFSMGAAYAMLLAANEPRVSAAVIIANFTSFRDIGRHNLTAWWRISPHIAGVLANILVPNGLDPVVSASSPGLPPAFFAHGTADGTIPYAMGEATAAVYNAKKSFLSMPGYNHGDYHLGPMAGQFRTELENTLNR